MKPIKNPDKPTKSEEKEIYFNVRAKNCLKANTLTQPYPCTPAIRLDARLLYLLLTLLRIISTMWCMVEECLLFASDWAIYVIILVESVCLDVVLVGMCATIFVENLEKRGRLKALVWFWLIDETLSANLVYQSDYKIGSTTPSDEAMAKIMTMLMAWWWSNA